VPTMTGDKRELSLVRGRSESLKSSMKQLLVICMHVIFRRSTSRTRCGLCRW
jgi:hypothetical protein